jgi:hypothetical protein
MSRRIRLFVGGLVWLALVLLSLEVGARLYWKIAHGVPFTRPADVLHVFYRDIEDLRRESQRPDPAHRDILVLGGSVVDEMRGGFEDLSKRMAGNTRFHVAARVAHTTLDSRRKYRLLEDLPYDEILIYDAINDCKYNSVPDGLFDDEYTAYPYYKLTAALLSHKELDYVVLPYTLYFAWIELLEGGVPKRQLPVATARPEWQVYGSKIKSARTYRQNLEDIVERAGQRGRIVHLATFASFIPENYTEERFRAGQLGYATPRLRVGVWGRAPDVRACISVHNKIVRDIAAKHANVHLIDVEAAIPREGRFFDDACHLAPVGQQRFFDALAAGL